MFARSLLHTIDDYFRFQFVLFPHHASIDGSSDESPLDKELRKGFAVRHFLQGRSVLVSLIVLRVFKGININASILKTPSVSKNRVNVQQNSQYSNEKTTTSLASISFLTHCVAAASTGGIFAEGGAVPPVPYATEI
jgi:hypothetical protein